MRLLSPWRSLRSFKVAGHASGDWMLFSLIGIIVLLGVFAIGRSLVLQRQVAATFQGWYEDYPGYQKAMADQAKSGKAVLVYFYAPWCPHCKHFTAEILSKPQMQAYVKRYPHVRIYPEKGGPEKQIMDSYGAEGFPTFFVAKKDGTHIRIDTHTSSTGSSGAPRFKSPEEFIQDIDKAAH